MNAPCSSNPIDTKRHAVIHKQASKAGLRGKINAFCAYCIYDPFQDSTWRKQVENCTSYACPLYPVRPVSCKPAGGNNE